MLAALQTAAQIYAKVEAEPAKNEHANLCLRTTSHPRNACRQPEITMGTTTVEATAPAASSHSTIVAPYLEGVRYG